MILEYCETPRSREELVVKFQFDSVSYFMKTYVYPLVEKGMLKMIFPEKPRSKFQKYYS
jgi:ATP-dependent DNA helicase RecG